jgi:hypothetical protein
MLFKKYLSDSEFPFMGVSSFGIFYSALPDGRKLDYAFSPC